MPSLISFTALLYEVLRFLISSFWCCCFETRLPLQVGSSLCLVVYNSISQTLPQVDMRMLLLQVCCKSFHVCDLSVPHFTCLAPALVTFIKPDAKDNFYLATIVLFHMQQKYSSPMMLVGLHIMVLLVCGWIGGLLLAGNHLSG